MRVLILGSGGREHAMAWRLSNDKNVRNVICAPGNPGMASLGKCLPLSINDAEAVLALAKQEAIDLTVVGPEAPLDAGLADAFRQAGRPIVGPGRVPAQLECSKVFSKRFMERHGIPTARFEVQTTLNAALDAVSGRHYGFPVVVKADGLAGGKGVVVAQNRDEAEAAVRACLSDNAFGAAGSTVLIEECLTGPEVSFFALCDGTRAVALGSAQDHKRAYDGDKGPNTGGMGAFVPSPLMTPELERFAMTDIAQRVLDGLAADGAGDYRGFLYISLMLTPSGPQVIEFNVRFGDPEAQVLLPAIEGPFAEALFASATGTLNNITPLTPSRDRFVGVVMASGGYPGAMTLGKPIDGLAEAASLDNVLVFHAGTRMDGDRIVTAGGRVLTVVGRGSSFELAMSRAYAGVSRISYDEMEFRTDIGRKALSKQS
jgi:phosphoribosylamine--glycine ligase